MPWSNQGGGWQGGGGQGPWGGRPGGGQQPPDLEELLRRSQEKVKRLFPGGAGGGFGGNRRGLVLIPLVVLAIWLASGFYRVQPDEQGVVLRFGEWIRTTQPGLNWHFPSPIETAFTPKVTRVNRVEVGFHRAVRAGPQRLEPRCAQRKPDADRRREHRRHQFRAVVADQGRRPVPVQHPRPRADGQGGRRERDARDHRQDADRRGDHRGPRRDRAGRARADAADPRRATARASWSTRCSCRRSTRRAK